MPTFLDHISISTTLSQSKIPVETSRMNFNTLKVTCITFLHTKRDMKKFSKRIYSGFSVTVLRGRSCFLQESFIFFLKTSLLIARAIMMKILAWKPGHLYPIGYVGEGVTKKSCCSFGCCPNQGEGEGPAQIFCHIFISVFLINKRSLFPSKCQ